MTPLFGIYTISFIGLGNTAKPEIGVIRMSIAKTIVSKNLDSIQALKDSLLSECDELVTLTFQSTRLVLKTFYFAEDESGVVLEINEDGSFCVECTDCDGLIHLERHHEKLADVSKECWYPSQDAPENFYNGCLSAC